MTIEKLTPEAFVSIPWRGPAIPNHDGTLALYETTKYTYPIDPNHQIRVMNIATGDSRMLCEDGYYYDANWVGDKSNMIICLRTAGPKSTQVVMIDIDKSPIERVPVGYFPTDAESLKVRPLQDGSIAVAVVGRVDHRGDPDDLVASSSESPKHTGRIFDTYVIHKEDNSYNTSPKSILYSALYKRRDDFWPGGGESWRKTRTYNALINTELDAPRGGHYDISQSGITLVATDPNSGLRYHEDVYYIPLDSFATTNVNKPIKINTQNEGLERYFEYPRFSPDGSRIAYTITEPTAAIYVHRLGSPNDIIVSNITKNEPLHFPNKLTFSPNGRAIYFTAQDTGRVGLYKVVIEPDASPKTIFRDGAVLGFYPLGEDDDGKLLVSSSSLVEPSLYQIVDADGNHEPTVLSSLTNNGAKIGLSREQVSELYFQGAGDYRVHAWMVKPRDFDESRKYPLAILIHGGPWAAWTDIWYMGVQENPALWAEQGYIVVAPNITGSAGYGLEFARAVQNNWGGRPYEDIVKCMEYLKHVPNVDIDNAVISGCSYGGYMVNWIQGHELGRQFKAMVSGMGIFNLPQWTLQTDRIHIDDDKFGGEPLVWKNFENMERYNPARRDLLPNWKTPMLIAHGEKDHRCPVTEGLAAFHALQALGTPSRLLLIADGNHGIDNCEDVLEWHRQVFAWVNKYTGIADETGRGKSRSGRYFNIFDEYERPHTLLFRPWDTR
ncbi:alpha/beta-hydrolase [Hypoxylon sp. EC38]|nr:alpha/beta-hydrolase [Hypoxylon sp. EC38]